MCPQKYHICSKTKSFNAILCIPIILMLSYFWYSGSHHSWRPPFIFQCYPQPSIKNTSTLDGMRDILLDRPSIKNTSTLDGMRDILLDRMLYEKPDAMKPSRTDVSFITPWLAPIVWNGSYNIDILNAQFHKKNVTIGLTMFAIKKYTVFLKAFLETAEEFFMVGHRVNYYVFTDRPGDVPNITLPEGRRLILLVVPSYKRWQDVAMRRMQMLRDYSRQRFINEVDYLVCMDMDMRFSDQVGVEILSDVFGTIHPGFYGAARASYTYERRRESTAYIPSDEGDFYYAAGLYGGTVEEIYKLGNYCHNSMMIDKQNNIEPIWHDESYLNKYFIYNKPTRILSPEYLWDNNFGVPGFLKRRRFVAVRKNHNAIRN